MFHGMFCFESNGQPLLHHPIIVIQSGSGPGDTLEFGALFDVLS